MTNHDDDQLAALAHQLPFEHPDADRVDAVRASLLVAATTAEAPARTRWFAIGAAFAGGAIAAAATLFLVVRSADRAREPREHHAEIEASTAADFERQITHTATGNDEVVRVRGGHMRIAGDHVRVATGDADVEGDGTYEVTVTADALHSVVVKAGTAMVRVTGRKAVFLAAGQTWTATITTADLVTRDRLPTATTEPHAPNVEPPPDQPTTTPSTKTANTADTNTTAPNTAIAKNTAANTATNSGGTSAAAPNTTAPNTGSAAISTQPAVGGTAGSNAPAAATDLEQHFAAGMRLLRAGKSAEAARELAAAADGSGNDALAADARYFEAEALLHDARNAEAEAALLAFLDHAPHSVRRGRASVMLGRLAAERHDTASARRWFELATHDADATIVAAGRAGLATL